MASRELKVSFVSDTKALERGFKSAESRTQRFANVAKTAGLAAGGILAAGLAKSVKAAMEAEKSQARMEAQLKASRISYSAHANQIETVIQKHSRLAGIDDEALQDAFTNIVRSTGDVSKSLNLVGLAADFARAKNIDAAKAGEIIGKVAGGNTGILSRYGIVLKDGASATEALGALQQRFAGQAEAYGKTTAGAQDRFRVAVENLQESIGQKLLPIITRVVNAASRFVTEMNTGRGAGGRFARTMGEIASALAPVLSAVRGVVRWLGEHPALLAAAGAAWVAYKAAAIAQIVTVRAAALGLFGPAMRTRMAASAGAAGATTGRSFALRAGALAAAGIAGWQIGKWLRDKIPAVRTAGDALGTQFAEAFGGAKTKLQQKVDEMVGNAVDRANEIVSNANKFRRRPDSGSRAPIQGRDDGRAQPRTRGPGARTSAFAQAAGYRPSYAQQLAEAESDIAAQSAPGRPEKNTGRNLVQAYQNKWNVLGARLNTIQGKLTTLRARLRRRGGNTKKNRAALLRLTQEEAALITEMDAITATISDLNTPAIAPEGDAPLAGGVGDGGAVGGDIGGDIGGIAPEPVQPDTSLADHTRALEELRAELERNRKFGESVVSTQNDAMARWVAAIVSGAQGQGLASRRLTPSIGTARSA